MVSSPYYVCLKLCWHNRLKPTIGYTNSSLKTTGHGDFMFIVVFFGLLFANTAAVVVVNAQLSSVCDVRLLDGFQKV